MTLNLEKSTAKESVRRLSCFERICEEAEEELSDHEHEKIDYRELANSFNCENVVRTSNESFDVDSKSS